MSNRAPLLPLATLLLAAAALVGCGGGSAEAPPPPVGPVTGAPDTTPPTVVVANNVAAATASGPVTFSFVFSEDVGVSFEATDIQVAGGTAGAFTRLSGTQATLVVTPTPNSAGTITVDVAAGAFSDIAGNASTAAASGSKDYVVSTPTRLTYSSGFAGGGRTVEGGAYFSYSGSNLDGFNCTGGPAWCGSGDGGSGATSFLFAYYQTPSPATSLYSGISVLAPGVTAVSTTGDTAGGVQINGQTTVDFTFNNNAEWQASGTNNFGVILKLGKFYDVDPGAAVAPCNVQLLAVVTPKAPGTAAAAYAVPLSSFQVIQDCGSGLGTVAAALASAPVVEIAFQATAGGATLPAVGGKTTGANLTVANGGGVYPTTIALTGGISFGVAPPAAAAVDFSTGFAAGNLTPEGGAYFAYSGSNQDGFNCTGGAAWCGSGSGGSGATSFFFAYYQTPTPATSLYSGVSVLAPGVTAVSTTGDTAGVQLSGQSTVNFTFNNNPEWQASGTNNFGVILKLGKFYDVDPGAAVAPCNIQLLAVVTPINGGAAAAYAVPLSSFQIIQSCNSGIATVADALASAPVAEVAFQATAGGASLPAVGGQSTGANLTVATGGGVYPTTIALTGGISFQP